MGVFLFYARTVNPTMFTAINKIASHQSKPTSLIKKEVERFLEYANKKSDATLRIRASNMILRCHSDGSCLSESDARSRAGGFIFLGDCPNDGVPNAPAYRLHQCYYINSSIFCNRNWIRSCIYSWTGSNKYYSHSCWLGYPQKETQITCDNQCAVGVANNILVLKRS